jgi:glycosyltransferase involved in cell wall biosynthesis
MVPDSLVSVGLPVCNGAPYLADALDSLLAQTYRRIEILVADNASSDATPSICKTAARRDTRVHYYRHEARRSAAGNFEFVRHLALGEYFMWAAHDDLRHPDQVRILLQALQTTPRAVLAFCRTRIIDAAGRLIRWADFYDADIESEDVVDRVASFAAEPLRVPIYGLIPVPIIRAAPPLPETPDADGIFLFRLALNGPFAPVEEDYFSYRWRQGDEYYHPAVPPLMGDVVLRRRALYGKLIRSAGLQQDSRARALQAVRRAMRHALANRFNWLVSRLLTGSEGRWRSLSRLAVWASQYPECTKSRLFWGAVRRIVSARGNQT